MFYVYCLQSGRKLYYGFTGDLVRRCTEHGPMWKLKYYEAYTSEDDARDRERKLKQYGQARTRLKQRIARSLK